MSTTQSSPFKLDQFTIAEFSIKRNPVKQGVVSIDIKPKGVINENKKLYTIFLTVKLEDDKNSFSIDLEAIGLFKFKNSIKLEELDNYFFTNAPAIIFPYIRSYISAVSALSGLSPINLPVMNLSGLRGKLKDNTHKVKSEK